MKRHGREGHEEDSQSVDRSEQLDYEEGEVQTKMDGSEDMETQSTQAQSELESETSSDEDNNEENVRDK